MPNRFAPHEEAEIAAIFARLREDIPPTAADADRPEVARELAQLSSRRELDRRWAVTAEREYLYRPGRWGRVRGILLLLPKAVLRRLMRWYVEPLAADQRAFNAALLRTFDELGGRIETALGELATSLTALEERIARLEKATSSAEETGEAPTSRR